MSSSSSSSFSRQREIWFKRRHRHANWKQIRHVACISIAPQTNPKCLLSADGRLDWDVELLPMPSMSICLSMAQISASCKLQIVATSSYENIIASLCLSLIWQPFHVYYVILWGSEKKCSIDRYYHNRRRSNIMEVARGGHAVELPTLALRNTTIITKKIRSERFVARQRYRFVTCGAVMLSNTDDETSLLHSNYYLVTWIFAEESWVRLFNLIQLFMENLYSSQARCVINDEFRLGE